MTPYLRLYLCYKPEVLDAQVATRHKERISMALPTILKLQINPYWICGNMFTKPSALNWYFLFYYTLVERFVFILSTSADNLHLDYYFFL